MRCEDVLRALRGEEPLSRELAEHLGSCESCRASRAADEALLAELRADPAPEPDPGHGRRFRRELDARLRAGGAHPAPGRRASALGLAAAAVLLLAIGVVTMLPLPEGPGDGAPAEGPMAFLRPEGLTQGELAGLEEAVLTLMPASGEEIGAQAWATALGAETDWIGELSDEEQRALLEALDEDLGQEDRS
jgi:hypothetical protein